MRPTPPGCGRTGGPRAATAAARRGKGGRCCRACCAAAGAGGSCRPATPAPTGNSPRYVCARAKQLYAGEHVCQSIGGIRLEQVILAELFKVLEPASLEATAKALAEADDRYRQQPGRLRAGRRARPLRSRAGPPPVRRGRAGEPAGRPHPGARLGRQARRRPARRERPARPAGPPPGLADQRGTRLDHHGRRRHRRGVPRADDHRPRAQAAAARSDHRGRRHHPHRHPRRGPEDHLARRRRHRTWPCR